NAVPFAANEISAPNTVPINKINPFTFSAFVSSTCFSMVFEMQTFLCVYDFFSFDNKFTNNLSAPGTPAGNCRKNDKEVYTNLPFPCDAINSEPGCGVSPLSFMRKGMRYFGSQFTAKYSPLSCTQPSKSCKVILLG